MVVEKESFSFIVRVWKETSSPNLDSGGGAALQPGGDDTGWRGSIDCVGSGKRLYFQDYQGMLQFIREQTGAVFKQSRSFAGVLSRLFRAARRPGKSSLKG